MTSISPAIIRFITLALGCTTLGIVACQNESATPDRNPDRCFILVASVTPNTPVLVPSDSVHLAATYNDVSADCLPSVPASALVWRSADPAIASVDSLRGEVTAHAAGLVQISAYAPGGSSVLGSASVKVSAP
jgi:hypothetical protein